MPMTGSSDLIGKAPGGRKLIAVVYADMVGYSRLIGLDDIGTFERLQALRHTLIDPAINEHGGRIVQTGAAAEGDAVASICDIANAIEAQDVGGERAQARKYAGIAADAAGVLGEATVADVVGAVALAH